MRCARCGNEVFEGVDGWYSTHTVNDPVTGDLTQTDQSLVCDVDGYPHGPIIAIEEDQ